MKNIIYLTAKEIFFVLSAFLIVFSCLEVAWPQIVFSQLNLLQVLILWILDVMVIVVINNLDSSK